VPDKITVLLADDHSLVRRGFRRLLDDDPAIDVIGEAADGEEAVALAARLQPRVIVMDCVMPKTTGIEAMRRILAASPQTAILMLSMHSDAATGVRPLTPRELEVLQLICDGLSNREIAATLDLSVNTISVHRTNIMTALGVHKAAELVVYAMQHGLVKLP
jgi:DNA-binding NarL/FixJ family response regulator